MSSASKSPPDRVPGSPAVEVEALECSYGDEVILHDLSFRVGRGELFFIAGGSGCGKSTLLRNLVGLTPPTRGSVKFLGRPFTAASERVRRAQLKRFGMLFQSGALWSSLTLRENVSLPLEQFSDLPAREIRHLADHRLGQVGLAGFEDYYPSEISGGMKKRAGLARALALDPELVFFDEPTAGLDPINSRHLEDLVRRLRQTFATTMVIVSHELRIIYGLADRLILLDRDAKGIIAEGRPAELAASSSDPRVREFLRADEPEKRG